jgi:DNA-binding YbaB/EbfC family protein
MAKGKGGRPPMPGGGGGGQLNQMMKQMQKMQADMAAAQDALADATVEGSAGGGMVKVVVTGTGEVQSVQIKPEVVDPDDVEMLEDLVLAAVTDGLRRSHDMQQERLGGVTGGLDLGALGDIGGLLG